MQPGNASIELVSATPGRADDAGDGLFGLLETQTSLTGSEAKVIVALLSLRTATLKQLSEATGIRRSNIHVAMDSLAAKGLCRRLGGRYSVWECPEPTEVLARLRAAEEARLDAERNRLGRTFEKAEALLAATPSGTKDSPFTFVDDAQVAVTYLEALRSVEAEMLVLNREPYAGDLDPIPEVLDALARGVKARALYVSAELEAPDGKLRACADAYAAAGVDQRVADSLPAAMVVIGNDMVLLSLPSFDSSAGVSAYGAAIRNQGMAQLGSAAFEYLWAQARPYQPPRATTSDNKSRSKEQGVGR